MTTKYGDVELRKEINTLLDHLQSQDQALRPQWVTMEICRAHTEGLAQNEHAPFWEYGGYTQTRKLATVCINAREQALPDEEGDGAPYLPGFEYLQRYYVVQRQGEDVGVPVLECTDEELYAKAALYRSQSRKLVAHADEIERYIQWRAQEHARASNE